MSNMSQADIASKLTHESDGSLRIRSLLKLQYRASICLESVWKPTKNQSFPEMVEMSVHIGDHTFHLPRSPVLLAHTELVFKEKNTPNENQSLNDTNDQYNPNRPKRVHMVTRYDGVEVFLDPISAAFWGGNRKLVKEVSVRTAAFVLKTDQESVIESASSASAQNWELIDAALSIISLATQIKSHIENMNISQEELTARSYARCTVS